MPALLSLISMFQSPIRKIARPLLTDTAEHLRRWRVGPGALMIGAFAACLGSIACIAFYRPIAGLGFMVLNRLLSALATSVAHLMGHQMRQAYLNNIVDALFFAGLPLGFALEDTSRALAAGFLILGFVLAAAARCAESGRPDARHPASQAHPLLSVDEPLENGLMFVALGLACFILPSFSLIAYIAGVLLFALAGIRVADRLERL
jgi:hypothetical protein